MNTYDGLSEKRKKVILRKLFILSSFLLLCLAAFFVSQHYFYMLDSYYYTAEFHYFFMTNNIERGNVGLFTEYFESLGTPAKTFSMLSLSYVIQSYLLPFSHPVLSFAMSEAFGVLKGSLLSYLSLFVVGIFSFGLGIFFLGDILPSLQHRVKPLRLFSNESKNIFTGFFFAALFALPFVAVSIPAIVASFLRFRFRTISLIMFFGLAIRILWIVSFSETVMAHP
jgi:hypothetical protein